MIPVRAQRRSTRPPIAVWMIALACIAVLVRLAYMPDPRAAAVVLALGVTPTRFLSAPLQPDRLLTLIASPFLHAGWIHLVGNMIYLVVFGPPVLDRLGTTRFVGLYMTAGIVGAIAHSLANPSSTAPLVGASGAIAGVLGAHLVLEPRARVTTVIPVVIFFEVAALPAAFVIGVWFALQLASAMAPVAASAAPAAIAWYAHIGGFAAGLLLGMVTLLTRPPAKRRRHPEGRRRSSTNSTAA